MIARGLMIHEHETLGGNKVIVGFLFFLYFPFPQLREGKTGGGKKRKEKIKEGKGGGFASPVAFKNERERYVELVK